MSNNETTDVVNGIKSIEDAGKRQYGTTLGSATGSTSPSRVLRVTRPMFFMKRKGSVISTTDEEYEDNDDDSNHYYSNNNNMNDAPTNKHEDYNEIFRDSSGYGSPLFASMPVGPVVTEPNKDTGHPARTSPPSLPSLPFLNQNSKSPHRQHQQRIFQRHHHHHHARRQLQLQPKPDPLLGEDDNEKQQQHYPQQQLQHNEQCDTVGTLSAPNHRTMLQRQTSSKRNLWWQQSIVRRTVSFVQDEVERIISNSPYLRTHAQQAIPVAGLDHYDDDDENDSPYGPQQQQQQQGIALFHRSEIQTGQCLGYGGFSVVYEISGFVLSDDVSDRMTYQQQSLREEYVRTCLDPITKSPRYAIKYLKESLFLKSSTNDPFLQAGRTATSSVTTAGTPPVPRTNSTTTTMITPVGTKSIVSCSFDNGGCNTPKYYGTRSKQSSLMMIPPESPVVAKNKYQGFQNASLDLAIEAAYMSSFDHPNIMKVRGLPVDGYQALSDGNHDGYFIVMDKLTTTLDAKIHTVWKPQEQSQEESTDDTSYLTRMHEKATCALQLAEALDHLHAKGILFRDVKPHNIGFVADHEGERLVLFDFGLCREIPVDTHATLSFRSSDDCETDEDDTGESAASSQNKLRQDRTRSSMDTDTSSQLPRYQMSGGVGTRRYMAPEVATGNWYNTKADVYSWAMVVWEMISLNKPYPEYTAEEHKLHVCQEGERPQFRTDMEPTTPEWKLPILPAEMQDLLRLTWEQDIDQRLSMKEVCTRLSLLLHLLQQHRKQLGNNVINDENDCGCILAPNNDTPAKENTKNLPFPGSPTTVCIDPERIVRVEDLAPPNSNLSFPTNTESVHPDWESLPAPGTSATATAINDGGTCSSIELLTDRFFSFLRLPLLRIPSFYSNVPENPVLLPKDENENNDVHH